MSPKRSEVVNFRITEEGKDLLYQLQDYYGVSQSSVFEMLLRERARDLDLKPRVVKRKH
jgi:antitoxin component of RelBE/YafQ-DinJ toxin-antitoxin module